MHICDVNHHSMINIPRGCAQYGTVRVWIKWFQPAVPSHTRGNCLMYLNTLWTFLDCVNINVEHKYEPTSEFSMLKGVKVLSGECHHHLGCSCIPVCQHYEYLTDLILANCKQAHPHWPCAECFPLLMSISCYQINGLGSLPSFTIAQAK